MKILEITECSKCKKDTCHKFRDDGTRYCTEHEEEKSRATDAPQGEKL